MKEKRRFTSWQLTLPEKFELTNSITQPLTGSLKSGLFSPLDYDPYLLFDAQTSMLGELEAPTLDLDASDESTLDVITATRAGVATYTDLHGVIKTASADTVRVDWSLGYPAMLIETSATNFLTYSISFVEFSGAIRVEGIDAPDGSNDANRISNAQAVADNFVRCATTTVPTGSAIELSGSVYVRGVAGETVRVNMKRVTAGPYVASPTQTVVLTGDWQRVENLTLTTDPANDRMAIYFNSAGATADTVDVWGGQIEEGSVSTSYIPTSGSAGVRNADNLVIDGTAFSDFYNGSEGTFYAESITRKADGQPFVLSANTDSNNRIVYYNTPTAASVYVATNGVAQANLNVGNRPAAGTLSRGSFSYKINNIEASVDGGGVVSDTSATIPSVNKLTIGRRITGESIYTLNGHIKRLIYWPTHSSSL